MPAYLVTSESVTEGHPDKLCDQISDGILDAYLEQDPLSHVAVETMVSKNTIFIAGEVTSNACIDVSKVARKIACDIGYTTSESGLDGCNCLILTNINTQSLDIAQAVNQKKGIIGAGDQGIMYGYACDESETYMPLTYYLATKLCMQLAHARKIESLPWLYPDGKSQVTMEYNANGEPSHINSIIVSAHHKGGISADYIRESILHEAIYPVIDNRWLKYNTKIYVNPTGSFSIGGPMADTGLTGRKIMVDSYGSIGKHGGGAFSGKDPTKVDRSAAYMARYVAKHIVASKLARRCEVALAYAIGRPEPEAVSIKTFGTEQIPLDILHEIVGEVFSFSVKDILEHLNLRRPQYLKTAAYGHFGRENQDFRWEALDQISCLCHIAMQSMTKKFFNKMT